MLLVVFELALILAATLLLFLHVRNRGYRFRIKELLAATGLVALVLFIVLRQVAPMVNKYWATDLVNRTGAEVFFQDQGIDILGQTKKIRRITIGQDTQALVVAQQLERIPDVTDLHLYMGVSDAGLRALCRTAQPLSLDELYMETSLITNAGLENLTHLKELRTLACSVPGLDDTGIDHLRAVPGLQHLILREFGWNGPVISVKSLRSVGGIEQLVSLELRYEGNKAFYVDNDSLRHLYGLKQLRLLKITKCRVSAAAVAELRAALPDCEIKIEPPEFIEPN